MLRRVLLIFWLLSLALLGWALYVQNVQTQTAMLQQQGNTNEWVFPDGTALVIATENRPDGLINWDEDVRCPNREIKPWESGIGYTREEFASSFEIKSAPKLLFGTIMYQVGGQTYARSTGCRP